jgi:hypothetical protein
MGTLLFFGGLRAAAGGAPTLFLPLVVVVPFLGNVLGLLLSELDAFCATFWLLLGSGVTTEATDDGSLFFSNDFDFEKVVRSVLTCGNICDEDDGSLPTYIVSKHNKTTHQTHEVSGEFVICVTAVTLILVALRSLYTAICPFVGGVPSHHPQHTCDILFFRGS